MIDSIVHQEKFKDWKGRFKKTLFLLVLSISFIGYQQYQINKIKLEIPELKKEIKSTKEKLNYYAFNEDEKHIEENEKRYRNKKVQERIEKYNLEKYKKVYDFFEWPVYTPNECYTPYPSTEYGYKGRIFHPALDIQSPFSADILSAGEGVVYNHGKNELVGNFVVMYHNFGGEEFLTVYEHLSKVSVYRQEKIKQGEKIGLIGSTGKDQTGIHLHFATYKRVKMQWISVNFVSNSLHKKNIEVTGIPIYRFLLN